MNTFYGSEYTQNGRINAYEALRLYNDYSRIYGDTSCVKRQPGLLNPDGQTDHPIEYYLHRKQRLILIY